MTKVLLLSIFLWYKIALGLKIYKMHKMFQIGRIGGAGSHRWHVAARGGDEKVTSE